MPTDDYINRSDVLSLIVGGNELIGRGWLIKELATLPAADVEPVVHCRDCKYRNQRIPVHNAICTKCYEMDCMQGYGFCSMGERMEEDDA